MEQTALAKIEPLALPDPRRPTQMPSLPAWVITRVGAMRSEPQLDHERQTFREMTVLPAELVLTLAQQQVIIEHSDALRSWMVQTPQASPEVEVKTLELIAKMLSVLPSQRTSEAGAEMKAEAYLMALDDVPWWAVEGAIRRWYRSECGTDDRGRNYDYHWAPDPAAVRRIAMVEALKVKARIDQIESLLGAGAYVDYSEDFARGRAAVRGLARARADGTLTNSMTFEQAIALGGDEPDAAKAQAAE